MHHLQILNRAKTKTTTSRERGSRSRSWHRRVEERYMLQLLATKGGPRSVPSSLCLVICIKTAAAPFA